MYEPGGEPDRKPPTCRTRSFSPSRITPSPPHRMWNRAGYRAPGSFGPMHRSQPPPAGLLGIAAVCAAGDPSAAHTWCDTARPVSAAPHPEGPGIRPLPRDRDRDGRPAALGCALSLRASRGPQEGPEVPAGSRSAPVKAPPSGSVGRARLPPPASPRGVGDDRVMRSRPADDPGGAEGGRRRPRTARSGSARGGWRPSRPVGRARVRPSCGQARVTSRARAPGASAVTASAPARTRSAWCRRPADCPVPAARPTARRARPCCADRCGGRRRGCPSRCP